MLTSIFEHDMALILAPSPQDFLTELATNATNNGVSIIFYSGNDDSLLPHRGTEGK